MKKTVIVGASPNKARYAYSAAEMLIDNNHPIVPVGIKNGEVFGEKILDVRQFPEIRDVDTVTLYIGRKHQPSLYNYLLGLKPKRIIFNPGTENPEFGKMAEDQGVEAIEACTLVMLRSGQY